MNEWEDLCKTTKSSKLEIIIVTSTFLYCMYVLVTAFLFYDVKLMDKLISLMAIIVLIYLSTLIIRTYIEENRTIKFAILGIEKVMGYCYSGKEFIIDFSRIKSIEIANPDFFMKNTRLFKSNKKGLNIWMKNGKLYRASPYLKDLDIFRQVLEDGFQSSS